MEVGQTQNRETMALRTLITIDLFYFIMCEDPTQIEIDWNSNCLRARSHMASHYTWRPVTTLHGFGSVLGRHLDTSFGLSQFHGPGPWLVCEVALSRLVDLPRLPPKKIKTIVQVSLICLVDKSGPLKIF